MKKEFRLADFSAIFSNKKAVPVPFHGKNKQNINLNKNTYLKI
ncbi:hypothetical protein V7654_19605 [Bacillus sp. JJ1609]